MKPEDSIEAKKLMIQVGLARSRLESKYNRLQRTMHFDLVTQGHLHCQRVIGQDTPYNEEIDQLERLESEYEETTGTYCLPRWRVRRSYMQDAISGGLIEGDENVKRSAEFIAKIDAILVADDARLQNQHEGNDDGIALFSILHPAIIQSSWQHFETGFYRDSVLNAMLSIGDQLRARTGLELDGKKLVEAALSPTDPYLVLSDLNSESGRNDQIGFMNMLSGAFTGIRNPIAHSLQHNLDSKKTAQYLVLASLFARRLEEAMNVKAPQNLVP